MGYFDKHSGGVFDGVVYAAYKTAHGESEEGNGVMGRW